VDNSFCFSASPRLCGKINYVTNAFPDPLTYEYPEWVQIGRYVYRSDDVVAYGTPLTPQNVREAYARGIFPWYTEGLPLPWHCPAERAILEFADLRIPRSLAKEQRKAAYSFTIDKAFAEVIHQCSLAYRPGQGGTWITPDFTFILASMLARSPAASRFQPTRTSPSR